MNKVVDSHAIGLCLYRRIGGDLPRRASSGAEAQQFLGAFDKQCVLNLPQSFLLTPEGYQPIQPA